MTEQVTVTITQTDSPSISKSAGPCWIAVEGTYATVSGREIECTIGQRLKVTGRATLRRATRVEVCRDSWTVIVTGARTDTVTASVGSPQAVTAVISGVVMADVTIEGVTG